MCKEQGSRLLEGRKHSIDLDPVGELRGFPLVPCQTVVWLGWRGGRKRKVKTTIIFISSVQGTQ
jgi:hypothetical protein